MKKIKLFALAIPLMLGLNIGTANANVIHVPGLDNPSLIALGTISTTQLFHFDGGSIGGGFDEVFHTVEWFDKITFTLAADTAISTSFSDIGKLYKMDLSTPEHSLIVSEFAPFFELDTLLLPNDFSPYVTSGLLKAGSYELNLKSTEEKVGFSGSINIANIAAVPEPETYAMLLAGLGLIGFTARRRKTQA